MSDVPSNLIPTRVTQLPIAPVADENSLMMIVYQGNNYQIRVGDLLSVAGVPITRQVIAGSGLDGGGQLSSNVTLSIATGGVVSSMLANTGVTPGSYGTATSVPVFTVDAKGRVTAAGSVPVAVSGYVPVSREVIAGTGLTGGGALNNNVTLNANLSNATPLATDGLGAAGASTAMSRADHQHPSVNLQNANEVDGVLPLSNGGTARSLVPDEGAVIWCGNDGLYVGPVGAVGQALLSGGTGEYTWHDVVYSVNGQTNVAVLDYADVGAPSTTGTDATGTWNIDITGNAATATNADHADAATQVDNAVTFNSSGGAAPGTSFNGSAARTVDYSTVGAPKADGTGATGTWAIAISGNAATATLATAATNVAGGGANQLPYQTGASTTSFVGAPVTGDTFLKWTGSGFAWAALPGAGTVTSVGLALPSEFNISNSPVTSAGTLTGAWANQTANYVLAGPTTGSATTPTFRALVDADIPSALTGKSYNGVTPTALSTGWKASGGTTAVEVSFLGGAAYSISGTNSTAITLPSSTGTVALDNQQFYIGTTQVAINRSSASLSLTGVSIDGLAGSATNVAGGNSNQLVYNTAAGTTSFVTAPTVANTYLEWSGSAFQWSTNPLGTVTSVGLALPSEFTISNSPVTTTGTLTGAWASQTANYFLAAPNGSPGTPSFRAMVAADVPTLNQNTTGQAGSVANSVTFDSSGTGGASPQTFNGSAAVTISRNTLGAAASGSNSDITSMSGITGGISSPDYVQLDTGATVTPAVGRLWWDGSSTLNVGMTANVTAQVAETLFIYVKASAAITKGQVVVQDGSVGASGVLKGKPAPLATSDAITILGIAAENLSLNAFGLVQVRGYLRGFDTSGSSVGETWADGDLLYYNPAYVGGLTKVKPSAPNIKLPMCEVVTAASGGNGEVLVIPGTSSVLGGTDSNVQFGTLNNGDVIVYNSTAQYWANVAQSTLTAGAATNVAGGGANQIVYNTAAGTSGFITAPTVANTFLEWSGSAFQWAANPLGTVTSVGLALPAEFTISNSPVTTTGTLTGAWANQTANYVFAGPTTGSATTPTFRALVAGDIPTLNQNTTGSAASLSISGQTGLLTFTGLTSTNRIKTVRDAADTILELGGSYTPSGTWNWTSATVTWPTFNQNTTGNATTATNLSGGVASQIPYQSAANTTAFLANGTSGQVLKSGGTGAPSWANIDGGTF